MKNKTTLIAGSLAFLSVIAIAGVYVVTGFGDCCFACPAESGHDVNTGNGYYAQKCERSRN